MKQTINSVAKPDIFFLSLKMDIGSAVAHRSSQHDFQNLAGGMGLEIKIYDLLAHRFQIGKFFKKFREYFLFDANLAGNLGDFFRKRFVMNP